MRGWHGANELDDMPREKQRKGRRFAPSCFSQA
jgi:hypothetical protein